MNTILCGRQIAAPAGGIFSLSGFCAQPNRRGGNLPPAQLKIRQADKRLTACPLTG